MLRLACRLSVLSAIAAVAIGWTSPGIATAIDSKITNAAIYAQANSYQVGSTVGNGQCFAFTREVFRSVAARVGSPSRIGFTSIYGYHDCYVQAGGVEVAQSAAVRGDIIQIYNPADPFSSARVHSAVVVNNLGGGLFDVIDQNYSLPLRLTHRFRWRPAAWAGSGRVSFWRLGTPPPPAALRPVPVSGDFNGDGRADTVCLYDYGNAKSALFVFLSNGSSFSCRQWWSQKHPGWWDAKASKLAVGDVNGDRKDDPIILYDYGNAKSALFSFISNGSSFSCRQWWSQMHAGWF